MIPLAVRQVDFTASPDFFMIASFRTFSAAFTSIISSFFIPRSFSFRLCSHVRKEKNQKQKRVSLERRVASFAEIRSSCHASGPFHHQVFTLHIKEILTSHAVDDDGVVHAVAREVTMPIFIVRIDTKRAIVTEHEFFKVGLGISDRFHLSALTRCSVL